MSRSNGIILGITALGAGAGYYLYRAGGDPELAKKGAEKDINKAANEIKQNLPGSAEKAKKEAEEKGKQVESSISRGVDQAKNTLSSYGNDASRKLDEARKETGNALTKGVDKFDQTVQEGANKAKSGISGWFGGGK